MIERPDELDFDDSFFQYPDDDFDDPNLYLPNHFITNFDPEQLSIYEAAIAEFNQPERELEIDKSGQWGMNGRVCYALLCHSRGDLGEFWKIVDRLCGEVRPEVV